MATSHQTCTADSNDCQGSRDQNINPELSSQDELITMRTIWLKLNQVGAKDRLIRSSHVSLSRETDPRADTYCDQRGWQKNNGHRSQSLHSFGIFVVLRRESSGSFVVLVYLSGRLRQKMNASLCGCIDCVEVFNIFEVNDLRHLIDHDRTVFSSAFS
jgi:hypothetical protein